MFVRLTHGSSRYLYHIASYMRSQNIHFVIHAPDYLIILQTRSWGCCEISKCVTTRSHWTSVFLAIYVRMYFVNVNTMEVYTTTQGQQSRKLHVYLLTCVLFIHLATVGLVLYLSGMLIKRSNFINHMYVPSLIIKRMLRFVVQFVTKTMTTFSQLWMFLSDLCECFMMSLYIHTYICNSNSFKTCLAPTYVILGHLANYLFHELLSIMCSYSYIQLLTVQWKVIVRRNICNFYEKNILQCLIILSAMHRRYDIRTYVSKNMCQF